MKKYIAIILLVVCSMLSAETFELVFKFNKELELKHTPLVFLSMESISHKLYNTDFSFRDFKKIKFTFVIEF